MLLVNETHQKVFFTISSSTSSDCGQIDVHGSQDVSAYDNQTNVTVHFSPVSGSSFTADIGQTRIDELLKMEIRVE